MAKRTLLVMCLIVLELMDMAVSAKKEKGKLLGFFNPAIFTTGPLQ